MSLSMTRAASTPATEHDPRWRAVVNRDRARDGAFVYAVKTTGVYCRPSCPSRIANAANVSFHATCEDAEKAGFRACKRCQPNGASLETRHAETIAAACRAIEAAETAPKLDTLAAASGLSPYHFHRLFKTVTGLTPRDYGAAHRAGRVRKLLANGSGNVTEAIYGAGYNSSSRFYEASNAMLGMRPTAFRDAGAQAEIKFAIGECSLGAILVACSEKGVCAILIGDDPDALVRDLQDRFANAKLIGGDRSFERIVAHVVGFIETPALGLNLPLDVRGTAFQQRVWQALRKIPAGRTATYTEIAKKIGSPAAVRAVASACAANAHAVAIPCHRVVRRDGSLSGYRWGVERKRALIEREKSTRKK